MSVLSIVAFGTAFSSGRSVVWTPTHSRWLLSMPMVEPSSLGGNLRATRVVLILVAAGLVFLASACGLEINAPGVSSSASPIASTRGSPAPPGQLATYLQQVRPILRHMKAQFAWFEGDGFAAKPDHSWTVAARHMHKLATAFDANAIAAAAIAAPSSVRREHPDLVAAARGWSSLYAKYEDDMRLSLITGESHMASRASVFARAKHSFEDWWFAVRVEARKLGVPCPRDWRKLPGYPVTPSAATGAPDLFVGKWTGTDSFGQGPFHVEIRTLGDGKYVSIGAAGQRTLLQLRQGALVGTARMGTQGNIEASVRIEPTLRGTLKESITANVFKNGGDESGDVTNMITFERKSD